MQKRRTSSQTMRIKMMSGDCVKLLQNWEERTASLETLAHLFKHDRECFYELALTEPPSSAPQWLFGLSELASRVRTIISEGYEVKSNGNGSIHIVSPHDTLSVPKKHSSTVLEFLRTLNGNERNGAAGRDYAGGQSSELEVEFELGSTQERIARRRRVAETLNAEPRVLKVDSDDLDAVTCGMPAYVVYALSRIATEVVKNPSVVFEGIRNEGGLRQGFAYFGIPRHSFDNTGRVVKPPKGMVFAVYTDGQGFVFDWDWVLEGDKPGAPINWKQRFSRTLRTWPETTLVGVEDLKPSSFRPDEAWYSSRGDCVFWYASDVPAYAERVNEEMTVFKAFGSHQVVGAKIKNVSRLIEELRNSMATLINQQTPLRHVLVTSFFRQAVKGTAQRDCQVYGGLTDLVGTRDVRTSRNLFLLPAPPESEMQPC